MHVLTQNGNSEGALSPQKFPDLFHRLALGGRLCTAVGGLFCVREKEGRRRLRMWERVAGRMGTGIVRILG